MDKKLFDIEMYKNALVWEMAGYNYFHSLFDGSSLKSFGKYFYPFTDAIMTYKGDRLLAFSPREVLIAPGLLVIEELIEQNDGYYNVLKKQYKISKKANAELLNMLVNKKISDFVKNWNKYYIEHTKEIQILFYLDFAIAEWLSVLHRNNPSLYDTIIAASNPPYKSIIQEEEEELCKIKEKFSITGNEEVSDLMSNKKLVQKVKEHKERWGWIQNSYAGVRDIPLEEFMDSLKKAKLPKITKDKNNLPEKYELLAKTIGLLINMKDERKKQMLLLVGLMDLNLRKISDETGIPYEELKWFSHKEVEKIRKNKKYDRTYYLNQERAIFVANDEEIDITKQIVSEVSAVAYHKDNDRGIIRGAIANKGNIKGRARIITGSKDAVKMKSGEILVASMTRPDFIIAIKRAAAIVTDEGGVACHAAIIAREMNKPCIIATKIATKVIKDGDLIEVNANEGIVRIIEKAK